jgi:hypothetical protein
VKGGTITCLALTLLLLLTARGHAQGYPVTAGEHDGFTRVVVHAPPGVAWQLEGAAQERRLTLTPAPEGFDLSRVFDRISRDRLADARTDAGLLVLTLNCPCTSNIWEERPGLIVLDISDAAAPAPPMPSTPVDPVLPDPSVPQEASVAFLPRSDLGRAAGVAVARRVAADRLATAESEPRISMPSADRLLAELATPVARALSQGVLEPATNPPLPPDALLGATEPGPLSVADNIQISVVTDRQDPDAAPAQLPPDLCQEATALDFLLSVSDEPFGAAFGRLSGSLYGEFDQPDQESVLALFHLYLASGFGAEARALMANASVPVFGRDLLLGVSDILENRNSNSRLRLGQMKDCGGPAALLAILAGTDTQISEETAAAIALTFSDLTAALRTFLGPDVSRRLIDANRLDAARVVIGAVQRSDWTRPEDATLLVALLDRARGRPGDALARLNFDAGQDAETIRTRLDLALATGARVEDGLLETAEALANTERTSANGVALMGGVTRLRLRNGNFDAARGTIDRLRIWMSDRIAPSGDLADLESAFWTQLSSSGDDLSFLRYILSRDEWRDPALPRETQRAVAERLLDLGLGAQVLDLIQPSQEQDDVILAARAQLLLGAPDRALSLVADRQGPVIESIRAQALEQSGQLDLAARTLLELNSLPSAATLAVRAQDWPLVEGLPDNIARNGLVDRAQVARALSRAPGFLDPALNVAQGNANLQAPTPGIARAPNADELSGPPAANGPPSAPGQTPGPDASSNEPNDFSRLGLIRRSATLLQESAVLRETLAPLTLTPPPVVPPSQ